MTTREDGDDLPVVVGERVRIDPPPEIPGVCLNCQTPLRGPFCHACGQVDRDPAPHLRTILSELMELVWNWDSRLLGTLRSLVLRPGLVVKDYNAGRRVRHVSPFRLFLVASAIFLAIATTWAGFADTRFDLAPELLDQWPAMMRAAGWTMFLLVPGMAVLLKVAYARSGRPYVHHLVFAVQFHTLLFIFLVLVLTGALLPWTGWLPWMAGAGGVYVLAWPILALRRAYGSGWPGSIGKAVFVAWAHLTFVIPMASTIASLAVTWIAG